MSATHSYEADFILWWKDFWLSTPGMNPSPESKAAAWAGWHAGRAREVEVWHRRPSGPSVPNELEIRAMYYDWWQALTKEGDPQRRIALVYEAFKAGFDSAHSRHAATGGPERKK